MKKICNNLLHEREICAIYGNSEDAEKFDVGYILSVDEEFVLFAAIDPDGNSDGFYLKNLHEVFRLETDTIYLKKIEKLMKNKKVLYPQISHTQSEILVETFRYLIESHKLCSVYLFNCMANGVIGYLQTFNDDHIIIKAYDRYGNYDGVVYLRADDISMVTFGSSDEQQIEILLLPK